ncbi:ABC transporter ATP-binding protein [Streptomyces sp. WMMC500]|uniref:ABC transporter ATP-binding protein n=1 Tax=Streptomyces sp. WMMC500 TaxID=3015154 RepID=UPI00248C4E23|nr:ABC transporter ATP-binding protein [Streptomyces sp. WMMC500]WBB58901.1 ABC transporter ATP-binding protein [Streptomyces sp. WMMC500]
MREGMLVIEGVSVSLGSVKVVVNAALEAPAGTLIGLIGPNGAGKSTLIRTVYRHLRPESGTVRVDDRDVWSMKPRPAAQLIAGVPQETKVTFDVTVEELVAVGRTPYLQALQALGRDDRERVQTAMRRTGVDHMADRSVSTLSGGERQRVFLARALAQAATVLVLDEPTNHLDLAHQEELMRIVRDQGLTTVMAMHDLNLAAEYCDRLVVMCDGGTVRHGDPERIITPEMLRSVFGVEADVIAHPRSGRPHVVLAGRGPEPGA